MGLESTGVLTIAIYIVAIIEMPIGLSVLFPPFDIASHEGWGFTAHKSTMQSVSLHQLLISSFILW